MVFFARKNAPARSGESLVSSLADVVGEKYVLTGDRATQRYRTGYRFGSGAVAAVVRPGTLLEQWRVLELCTSANVAIITQASNTGLTGGSTPDGDDYDREIVIVSTTRIRGVHLIDEGRQAVCVGGATLDQLERVLKPIGREPHSVIGSSCIGASVIGGICNNSGGSLVHRGPAYTEMALFAAVDAAGQLQLVNHLGIHLGASALEILERLDTGELQEANIEYGTAAGSDHWYAGHVRDVDAETPSRYNADPIRLFEASGSAGKLMVFAVRVDTFAASQGAKVFYIGTNCTSELTEIRRHALARFEFLPIAGEYIHRDAYNLAERYGRDLFLIIQHFGTKRLPAFFNLKAQCDVFFERFKFFPAHLSDRILQLGSRIFLGHLPRRMNAYRDLYEHHLILKVQGEGVVEARAYLEGYFKEASGNYFECTDVEGSKAFLHRYAAASAAVRYRNVHAEVVQDIVALDVALRRDDQDWFESLPGDLDSRFISKIYYGHFLCHVFHQDYIAKKGSDCVKLEHSLLRRFDQRGAKYPAEHNVGHLYEASPELKEFYRKLDPCNCFNPGIGFSSKFKNYRNLKPHNI